MPKYEGLKIKDSRGCMIFLHHPKFRQSFPVLGRESDMPAGFYSRTLHEDIQGGVYLGMVEYLTYWGRTKPTPKQFRKMKKTLRRGV